MLITSGMTSLVLLLVPIMTMFTLATPATSVALGNRGASGNTSISNSVTLEKPQDLSSATLSSSSSSATITSKDQQQRALPFKKASISAPSLAQSSSSSSSLPAVSVSPPAPPPSIYTWGHVTKYSRILYDESIIVKGPIILDVKYPDIDNSNAFTIIGIVAYAKDDANTTSAADLVNGSLDESSHLPVYPVRGGIGYNSTIIRFSSNSTRERHYTLVIHGVDV